MVKKMCTQDIEVNPFKCMEDKNNLDRIKVFNLVF